MLIKEIKYMNTYKKKCFEMVEKKNFWHWLLNQIEFKIKIKKIHLKINTNLNNKINVSYIKLGLG